jgi:hypothetical protein
MHGVQLVGRSRRAESRCGIVERAGRRRNVAAERRRELGGRRVHGALPHVDETSTVASKVYAMQPLPVHPSEFSVRYAFMIGVAPLPGQFANAGCSVRMAAATGSVWSELDLHLTDQTHLAAGISQNNNLGKAPDGATAVASLKANVWYDVGLAFASTGQSGTFVVSVEPHDHSAAGATRNVGPFDIVPGYDHIEILCGTVAADQRTALDLAFDDVEVTTCGAASR